MTKQQIEWVRRQMGWTQEHMAAMVGYSLGHFRNILSGQRAIPADFTLRLKEAVSKEIKLNTKKYSNLKELLDCQEEKVNN